MRPGEKVMNPTTEGAERDQRLRQVHSRMLMIGIAVFALISWLNHGFGDLLAVSRELGSEGPRWPWTFAL